MDRTPAYYQLVIVFILLPFKPGTHNSRQWIKTNNPYRSSGTSNYSPFQLPADTCVITGKVTGKKSFKVRTEPGGPETVININYMYLESLDKGITSRALIDGHGVYRFTVVSGRPYRIYPGNFIAKPKDDTASCNRPNGIYHKNFKILGPPRVD